MAVSYTFGTFVATILGIVIVAFVFRQIVIPACIYIIEYYRNGQKAAEDKALASMGENRMSYGLKGGTSFLSTSAIVLNPILQINLNETASSTTQM